MSSSVQKTPIPPNPSKSARYNQSKLIIYSMVPLHVISMHLAAYHFPKYILAKKITKQRNLSTHSAEVGIIDCFVDRPIQALLVLNFSVALVQIAFTFLMSTYKKSALSSNHSSPSTKITTQISSSNSPGPPAISQISLLGDLALAFLSLLQKPRDQINPKLAHSSNQTWLALKEWTIINIITTVIMNILIVLIGSPTHSLDLMKKNFLLACLISSLCFFPFSVIFGWNQGRQKSNWIRIFSSFQPQNEYEAALLYPAIGTFMGCWLGAIPIPLDWDRPWQTWPITCVIGSLTGHAIGSFASILWF